jgi:hypothetical protein
MAGLRVKINSPPQILIAWRVNFNIFILLNLSRPLLQRLAK